ncbi:MAG: hypothetical protein JWP88_453 [Flaviaesturariibacter sp.]|nr:hypothetical protein [Flaviaesturariibacter sp.]
MIKTIFTTALAAGLLSATAQNSQKAPSAKGDVRFLDDIEVSVGAEQQAVAKTTPKKTISYPLIEKKAVKVNSEPDAIEAASSIQLKYALLLDAEVEMVQHTALFSIIEDWWGTKYHLGGTDKTGIDCSAFTHALYDTLYNINLPRTSRDQAQFLASVAPEDLKEGDLVFFSAGAAITHVGFYLQNNRFVHASTSEGVTISNLNDSYWAKRFVGIGRYDATATSVVLKP